MGLPESTQFQIGADGLDHRTAWAGSGDGVLFIDADNSGNISNLAEYVFTEWDRAAGDDMEALRRVFDTNGDGKLTSADARWGEFRVLVTNADGSTTTRTLAELGITEINLRPDATQITLPDGSAINGQTTFTIGGVTRTVANVTLAADGQVYRVVEVVSTDGSGNRVVVQTGYDATGDRAFVVKSVTSPSGLSITNSYDGDGDGVFDHIQTIQTVINGNGSRTETLVNLQGSDVATAALLSRTVTTTSADGKQVTIQTDSTGGGWFDRSEVRTTALDGSRTVAVSELTQDGSTIRSTSETISANGLVRVNSANLDGAGGADRITTETISYNGAGDRTDVVAITNQDGSARTSRTSVTTANGLTQTTTTDLNGDGSYDVWEQEQITRLANGTVSTVAITRNADASLRGQVNSTVSADSLTRTAQIDLDGDGDFDRNENDVTVINASGVRTRIVTVTNTDGSVDSMERTVLGADSVSGESWVDLNENGVFEATDLVRSVTVNGVTQLRTETIWDRNPDGSIRAVRIEETNSAGTSMSATIDADGDGDVDQRISDTTVVNANGSSTRTIDVNNQDSSRLAQTVIETSANGLSTNISRDVGGTSAYDEFEARTISVAGTGAVTTTVVRTAGNGTSLLSREVTLQSADRLSTTITSDTNGDGANDRIVSSVESSNGSTTVSDSRYHANGGLAYREVSTVSANGLERTLAKDLNGDGVDDLVSEDTTTLASNGSVIRHIENRNGDGSLASQTLTTVSDDGLVTVAQTDFDGDGNYDRSVTSTTTLQANGVRSTLEVARSASNTVLARTEASVSDDGLLRVTRLDADGDGDFDLSTTATTTLFSNGSVGTTTETRDLANNLRARTTITVTDDQRSSLIQEDVNGDGSWDRVTQRVVANNGTITENVSEYEATGALISRSVSTVSDDGLTRSTTRDYDGDGVFDATQQSLTTLNADGSATITDSRYTADNVLISRTTVTSSDDGWVRTTQQDIDGDGDTEYSEIRSYSLGANGIETATTTLRSENNSLIRQEVITTSADGRTVTANIDADGNGVNDIVAQAIQYSNGQTTTTTSYYSTGGALDARSVLTVSGDGLRRTESIDRNGDGRFDVIAETVTELGADGSVSTSANWRDDRYVTQAQVLTEVSAGGLETWQRYDLDGDGIFEFRGQSVTILEDDGGRRVEQAVFSSASVQIGAILTITSGDGLSTQIITDYTGDGSLDRTIEAENFAGGGARIETRSYGAGSQVREIIVATTSADGRTNEITIDRDGDGDTDRSIMSEVDLSRNVQTEYSDFASDGDLDTRIVEVRSANGMGTVWSFDLDGDGDQEISHTSESYYEADGDLVTIYAEQVSVAEPGYGPGRVVYSQRTTTSADGLQSVTEFDVNGDGVIDGQTLRSTTILADGSRLASNVTSYSDGSLRSSVQTATSANGMSVSEVSDYDGNGIADKVYRLEVSASGERVETETGYNIAGMQGNTFVTITSADGLVTTVQRPEGVQSITRSATDNGSYVWNNGLTATQFTASEVSSHQVDPLGIETWTYTKTWYNTNSFGGPESSPQVTTATVRVDAAAKATILAEAARLYDAILDRGMDYAEIESLVLQVVDGQLNRAAVATALLASPEFATRYGTLSDAEFLSQLYLNTYQRMPSLEELSAGLSDLSGGAQTRATLATQFAESVEHVVIGNGHLATNNFDVILNPAQFERSLDRAWVADIVSDLIDTVYDRDPTAQEMADLTARLLAGTENVDDLAQSLLDDTGGIQGVSMSSLYGLTGAALVEQAFVNALGRQPTAAEQQTWEENLSSGRITTAQFVASLAQSLEHQQSGNEHLGNPPAPVTTLTGTSSAESLHGASGQEIIQGLGGNDTLYGGAGSDRLQGGTGNDRLEGGAGRDFYIWAVGDGNDTISDSTTSSIGSDTLVLTGVNSTQVTLTQLNSEDDLTITIRDAAGTVVLGVIKVLNQFNDIDTTRGIEVITFADGVTWTLDDIRNMASLDGTAGNDAGSARLTGSEMGERIFGFAGNDELRAYDGDDTLFGGTGADTLYGGSDEMQAANGNDTYVWSKGEGNDLIQDYSSSLTEVDTLSLTDVMSTEVALRRAVGGLDLEVIVTSGGTTETITIKNQYGFSGERDGIEVIRFANGEVWTLSDIQRLTQRVMVGGNDSVSGTEWIDNIYGGDGNDSLSSRIGDDLLSGGTGNDTLDGQGGSDTYLWAKGDGNDIIAEDNSAAQDTDRLVFLNVASGEAVLTRDQGSTDLRITIGTEVIIIRDQFASPAKGVEQIVFSDGAIWTAIDILNRTSLSGNSGANTLSGLSSMDNVYGGGGNDTITTNDGNDLLVGGAGNDSLVGGNGSDRYSWAAGHGSDTINDQGMSLAEIDTLSLTGVAATAATLTRSGNNLIVTINGTGETITVIDRFVSVNWPKGIEIIEFSDGVITRVLSSDVAEVETTGTSAANTLNGWGFRDLLIGLDGNDTLNGGEGDDTLIGGKGNDSLAGGYKVDTYVWARGDGSDIITDSGEWVTEVDILKLTDVLPDDTVVLTRIPGSNDILVSITSLGTTETITLKDRLASASSGIGVDAIEFADGTIWYLEELLARTETRGGAANDSISGTGYGDNLLGFGGNDTLSGGAGNDVLVGGEGNDSLDGSTGSDRYLWGFGSGNDTINDSATSQVESDVLVLTDADPGSVTLTRANGSENLIVTVSDATTVRTITIISQFGAALSGRGIERIEFADGTIWDLSQILDATSVTGSTGNDSLVGSAYQDNLLGLGGNDTLSGNDGDDRLNGGTGADSLRGGAGSDTFYWSLGDGADTINDGSSVSTYVDTLELSGVAPLDVTLRRDSATDDLIVRITLSGGGSVDILVIDQFRSLTEGYGLERIAFADGTIWTEADIQRLVATYGTAGNDTLVGLAYGDRFFAAAGNDSMRGNDGNDDFYGGAGADTMSGGDGVDLVSYFGAGQGVSVDLRITGAQTGVAGGQEVGDAISAVENLEGSIYGDTLLGDENSNLIRGLEGNDSIKGFDGFDELWGGSGNDILFGGLGADYLAAGSGNDTFWGDEGDDTLLGEDGNDILVGGAGGDVLDGGAGIDEVRYSGVTAGVVADLQTPSLNTGDAAGDSYVDIENLFGSTLNDDLRGDAQANTIWGTDGDDTLHGREGNDTLAGGNGNDILIGWAGADSLDGGSGIDRAEYSSAASAVVVDLQYAASGTGDALGDTFISIENLLGSAYSDDLRGDSQANAIWASSGNDSLQGRSGDDTLYGGAGNDILFGGAGADRLDGGEGSDRADYSDAAAAVVASLQSAGANTGEAAGDVYVSIEKLYGSAYSDDLSGDGFNNTIWGWTGNDTLYGGAGADALVGGAGKDILFGGSGDGIQDAFVFTTLAETAVGTNRDVVYDFISGIDIFDLDTIDANTAVSGNQAFVFSGTTAQANSVWYGQVGSDVLVRGDNNGDGVADFEVMVANIATLSTGDFVL